jgi:hypothetical protein
VGLGRGNMFITQTGCKDVGQLELWKQEEVTAYRVNSQIQYPKTMPYTVLQSNKSVKV